MKQKGSNINTIKTDNSSLIVNSIRHRPMSRAEIAKITGLSKSAVTIITKQLIEQGKIVETGTESTSYGRHPILLDLVKDRRCAMGIVLDRAAASVCIVDLKLECVESRTCDIQSFVAPEKALLWAYETGMQLLARNGIDEQQCLGIGVAAPGPIDYKNGIILTPPNFKLFHNFDVKRCLAAVTQLPVFLNNAPVLLAMYEHGRRSPEYRDYMYVVVDNGVGSAIIQDGRINMGSAGFSGELGHTTVDINGPVCSCGNCGCLEEYVTRKALRKNYGISAYEALVDRAWAGEESALAHVRQLARYFATGIINSVNMLDLEAVIISGELNYQHKLLFGLIQKHIDDRSLITKAHSVKVLPALSGPGQTTAFAAANVIEKYFNQEL